MILPDSSEVKQDLVLGLFSLAVFSGPFFVNNEPRQIPPLFRKDDINPFDRSFMVDYNQALDLISDYSICGLLVLPVLSIKDNLLKANTLLTYGIMYTEAFLLTYGTQALIKKAAIRYRPYMYMDGMPGGKEDDYHDSLPSGAASLAFLGASFLSATFSNEYDESKWRLPLIIGSHGLAAGVASMRIAAGAHFVTDALAGAAIGSFYGWVLPFLHRRPNSRNKPAIHFTGTGFLMSWEL
jgi:membrane-associated phospholipid phosphatase